MSPHDSMFDLSGRVAVITGGAGLLGPKHAEAIAEFGGIPILVDVRTDEGRSSAEELEKRFGLQDIAYEADITDHRSVESMVQRVVGRFGRIDILINNAAMTVKYGGAIREQYFAPFEDYPLDLWERALKVNLTGMFLCTQAVGRVMSQQQKGVVINIASDVGVISPDHRIYEGEGFNTPISYTVSKSAVLGFTRHLATYWAGKNIRVNALSPAGVYDGHTAAFLEKLSWRIPMGRMATPDEYKGAIVFLAADASSFMTGANLIVDGGRTSW